MLLLQQLLVKMVAPKLIYLRDVVPDSNDDLGDGVVDTANDTTRQVPIQHLILSTAELLTLAEAGKPPIRIYFVLLIINNDARILSILLCRLRKTITFARSTQSVGPNTIGNACVFTGAFSHNGPSIKADGVCAVPFVAHYIWHRFSLLGASASTVVTRSSLVETFFKIYFESKIELYF